MSLSDIFWETMVVIYQQHWDYSFHKFLGCRLCGTERSLDQNFQKKKKKKKESQSFSQITFMKS